MAHKIGPECIGCGACAGECPTSCIVDAGGVFEIKAAECIDCGTCVGACPTGAIKPE
ncbi:4Fe-4S binding protein [Anaerotignum sp.]|uniref:4Fe-4S binding protein n=1 Tax=Anaerotignum sp. TaxID=2039241 RepID=UPI001D9BF826|nr:4Fe-4S binding protein [Anaerotignum sp.]MDD3394644.1 4Fe-4S binding protein [Anaerotignum sp.]NCC15206.1 ferredoxin [Clostridia bacterium]